MKVENKDASKYKYRKKKNVFGAVIMKSMYGFNWLNLFLKYSFITSRTTKLCDFKDIDAIADNSFWYFTSSKTKRTKQNCRRKIVFKPLNEKKYCSARDGSFFIRPNSCFFPTTR